MTDWIDTTEWHCLRCPEGTGPMLSHAAMLEHFTQLHGMTRDELHAARGQLVMHGDMTGGGTINVQEFKAPDGTGIVTRTDIHQRVKKPRKQKQQPPKEQGPVWDFD